MSAIVSLQRVCGGRLSVVGLLTLVAGVAQGQWSTSYTDPKVLATEVGTASIDVLTLHDGSVVAGFTVKSNDKYKIRFPRFAGDGLQMQPGDVLSEVNRPEHISFYLATPPNTGFNIIASQPRQTLSGIVPNHIAGQTHNIGEDGYWQSTSNWFSGTFIAADPNGRGELFHDHNSESLRLTGSFNLVSIGDTIPSEAQAVRTLPSYAMACYTRSSKIPGIPSEVWIMATHAPVAPSTDQITHIQVDSQTGVRQYQPQLTKFDDDHFMVTWLGESGGITSLYARLLTNTGQFAGGVFVMQDNVASSKACSSHLGVPVHAFVQRSASADDPVDVLWAGLIDPRNGVNLNLPMATGRGIDVKTLRQEENGDFSLVYSVVENNTTLLKTQRISGVTGMLMWETTVADLGMASPEFIRRYPNTAVAGFHNVLYFVTRKDNPYNQKVAYHLTRLRADGQLGSDSRN